MTGTVMAGELCVVLGTPTPWDLWTCTPRVTGTLQAMGTPPPLYPWGDGTPRVMGTTRVIRIPPGYLGFPG